MKRADMLDRVRSGEPWDVLVIGGGATGLGTAVDAASRGYRTLLLEASDFAKGTSSRSTKLIHGGVRYLARGEIGLVREALHERGILRQNAPHLIHSLGFVVPAYRWWEAPYYGLGLKVYDLLAGRRNLGRSSLISRDEALRHVPTLEPAGLRGGVLYHDGQFDDARLAITLARTLIDLGGSALNYARVVELRREAGRLRGVVARDQVSGECFAIGAKVIVNATGVYSDDLRKLDDPRATGLIRPSQGAHLVLDRNFLPGNTALMVPRTEDGRVLFAIPWHDRVMIGTTDTPVTSRSIEPRPMESEVAFLLAHAARYLARDPQPEDVRSTFAGLRPLIGSPGRATKSLSREHAIVVSDSGLVSIVGGKWTTYRRMAAETVDRAARVGELPTRPCITATLRLHGATEQVEDELFASYGSEAPSVRRLCEDRPALREPVHPRLPYLMGEVIWCARHELAITVEDILARRTRSLFLDAEASIEAAPQVASLLATELGLDGTWATEEARAFRELARGYLLDSSR